MYTTKGILVLLIVFIMSSCNQQPAQKAGNTADTAVSPVTANPEAKALKTAGYGGSYSYGDDAEKGPVGSMIIYPETDSSVLFFLSVSVGPPSYNSGELYDRLKLDNGSGIYSAKQPDDDKGCKWQVTIEGSTLSVKTLEDAYDCGFGANVIADGKYNRVSSDVPEYFIGGGGDTTYFSKTAP